MHSRIQSNTNEPLKHLTQTPFIAFKGNINLLIFTVLNAVDVYLGKVKLHLTTFDRIWQIENKTIQLIEQR